MPDIKSKHEKLERFCNEIQEHKKKSIICFLLAQQAKEALGKKAARLKLVEVKKENGVWFYAIKTPLESKPELLSEEEYNMYFNLAKDYIEGML